jgi:hypothetical protein
LSGAATLARPDAAASSRTQADSILPELMCAFNPTSIRPRHVFADGVIDRRHNRRSIDEIDPPD